MNEFIYKENQCPGQDEFFHLYETTGWNREYGLEPEEMHRALSNSWYMTSAYDGDLLVGFGRVLSDGLMHALITEMIVLPEYQGRGVGKELLLRITKKCQEHKIRDIQLFSAKGKAGFYRKYGYSARPENGPGMEIKFKPGLDKAGGDSVASEPGSRS